MTTTLPLFWHLSSASTRERLDSSIKLVEALEQFQAQYTAKHIPSRTSGSDKEDNQDDEENAPKSDGLDRLNAPDVSYSIRRLVRGLASPRESSRLGFAVALTELLSRISSVTCSQIVNLIMNGTKIQGSMAGQEERDILFARLFGLTAVIQSGLLVKPGTLATSASSAPRASSLASYEETVKQLVVLGEEKTWLRESAWWTITLAVDILKDSKISWKAEAVEFTLQHLFMGSKDWSVEKVALALKLQTLYPDRDWRKLLQPSFKKPDLLHTSNLQGLARILKDTGIDEGSEDAPKTSAGKWKPQLHFVWDIILDQLLPGLNSTTPLRGSFQEFFRVVVDESLFSLTASDERKYSGFQVFQKALPRVTQDTMPMLFTKNFMRSWINHLSHQDRYLHKVAKQAATEIQTFIHSNPQFGFALILQLTGINGSQQFDKLTKTKTVENILTSMDLDGIKSYIAYLIGQVSAGQSAEEIQTINERRLWIIEQLSALIQNRAIPKSDEWVQYILDWFAINGLFIIKKKSNKTPFPGLHPIPSPPFSDNLRQTCRSRLLSCLGDLNTQTTVVKSGEKSSKVAAVASDGESWVSKVIQTIQALENDSKHVSLLNPLEEEEQALCTKALQLVERFQTVSDAQQEAVKGVRLLLSATVLLQYCTGELGEVDMEALEACINGAVRMFPEGKKGQKFRKSNAMDETVPEPVDVFVDTIITFFEKSPTYMRTIGNEAFALLSAAVKESTIDLIIAQLERLDPSTLAQDGDEETEDDDVDEEVSEEDSAEASSNDGDGGNDDSNNEEEDVELRRNIEETLQVYGIEAATGETDDDEEPMDDDQMMAVDKQLAEVFRSRANEKMSKGVNAHREATHFKNRVLDLVDTFMKKQHSSPLIVNLIPPLIELMAGSSNDERQLSDKAKGILRLRISKSKEVPSGVETELALTVLRDLHNRAQKAHPSDILQTLSECSIYLSKILVQLNAENSLVEVYQQSLTDFLTRKNSALNAKFFQDFIRRCQGSAWGLRTDLLELSTRAVNNYRQSQAYQLLESMTGQLPAMDIPNPSETVGFLTLLRKTLLETATQACDEKISLTAAQLKQLLKLSLIGIRQTQRMMHSSVREIWQPESWHLLSAQLAASGRYKTSTGLRHMSEQVAHLAKMTDTSNVSRDGTKRKMDELEGAGESIVVTKKTKQKS